MSNMKRQFDGNRLYKLAKNLVIFITVAAILYVIYAYPIVSSTKYLTDCDKYPINSAGYTTCLHFAITVHDIYEENLDHAITTAILLPLLFFGGTALY